MSNAKKKETEQRIRKYDEISLSISLLFNLLRKSIALPLYSTLVRDSLMILIISNWTSLKSYITLNISSGREYAAHGETEKFLIPSIKLKRLKKEREREKLLLLRG
jgi:hypothetical protein